MNVEQISELNKKLAALRHDVNNNLALIIAAVEMIHRKPEAAERMWSGWRTNRTKSPSPSRNSRTNWKRRWTSRGHDAAGLHGGAAAAAAFDFGPGKNSGRLARDGTNRSGVDCRRAERRQRQLSSRWFKNIRPRVFATARRYARRESEIEDIAQEVWLKAFDKLKSFRGEAPFEHWLMRMTVRTCYDFLRGHQRNRESSFSAN